MSDAKEKLAAYLDDEGLTLERLSIVIFHDDREDLRWFERHHTGVGVIETVCECGKPVDRDGVHKMVLEAFGESAWILYP